MDTNSSALNFYFGFSGFHIENGDGIFYKTFKKFLNLFILFIVFGPRINVNSNYVSPYYNFIYNTWYKANLCGLHLDWIVIKR